MATKLWLDYAIRALNPVKKEVIEKFMEKSSLIETTLKPALERQGIKTDFKVIGSVAAQTHIESHSCVDLLVLFYPNNEEEYLEDASIILQLLQLKQVVQNLIANKFPEIKISDSTQLSITFFNQNLPLTINLFLGLTQNNNENFSRIYSPEKLKILNIKNSFLTAMDPCLNVKQLNLKDNLVNNNLKPLIRILKTIKNNSITPIDLTGHEITCIVYSMENYLLEKPNGQLLYLLLECSLFLKRLEDNHYLRSTIKSPDNETILNYEDDLRIQKGIHFLRNELTQLIKNLVLEIDLYTNIYECNALNS